MRLSSLPPSHPQVQQHWMAYMVKMDRMMEEAFRLNVKWSLVELSKAINGDGKTTPSPLFRVKVILQDNCPASSQVSPVLPSTPMTLDER